VTGAADGLGRGPLALLTGMLLDQHMATATEVS
jgi:hypothetical protein